MKDILAPAVDWTGGTWAGRIDQCASMLFCHGYIPMSVRDKITLRLMKECEASVDTHAERCDVEQAQPARVGSEVAATSGETPNGGTNG